MAAEFIHLHNHSEYSMLDGMLRITDVKGKGPSDFLKNLSAKKIPSVAITDHGNMYGAMDFYFNALKVGVKPIIGCEVYHALISRKDMTGSRSDNGHLTLLAKNNEGYKNLMKIVSDAFLNGFHYDPRVDFDLLKEYSGGLILLSGCLKSHVARACAAGRIDDAIKTAMTLSDIMGKGNFYLELMDHNIPEEAAAMKGLIEISKRTGLPLVATNDCHYEKKEDWEAHDASMCIGMGRVLSDSTRPTVTHELYFKSPEEMIKLFSHVPEAVKNTVAIAEMCNVSIETGKLHLPSFDVPAEYKDEKCGDEGDYFYLKDLCYEGLKAKVPTAGDEYIKRLEFELGVIRKMGFSSYFLIVRDFIMYARKNHFPVGPGRGSGAGALVAFTLDITRIDPLKYDLLFERFLNPDRKSMPDLDIDFSEEGREKCQQYIKDKYGETRVANIITYGTIKSKSAVKDISRIMEIPLDQVNKITKLIPDKITLAEALNGEGTVKELTEFARDPKIKKMFSLAVKMEGLVRQTGVHAAGVLVSKEEITNYSPLANRNNKNVITTQYDGPMVADTLGMLKVDFLGLRTLDVIDITVDFIRENGRKDFDIYDIPLDDKKTFDLLCEGKTTGVFQLESEGMKKLVKGLQPTVFSDISALVALYRPGPIEAGMLETFVERKHGRQKVTYDHPLLESVLKDTYGTMLYQEQVMEISKKMAGFTPGEADGLRKAMGKKKVDVMAQLKEKFVAQANKINNVPTKVSEKIYDQMAKFAGYGFNKSHSVAYALVTYQVSWLKANYPVEFMASLMSSEIGQSPMGSDDKENKLVTYISEAQNMDIEIKGPDVNYSQTKFSIDRSGEKPVIRFALTALKNVGEGVVESIVEERKKNGPYKSFEELTMRVDSKQLNKRCLEAMSKGGAFDCLYPSENKVISRAMAINAAEEFCNGSKKVYNPNQSMLFAEEKKPEIPTLSESVMLKYEYEFLGLYFSGHPLNSYRRHMRMISEVTIESILKGEKKEREIVRVTGMINQLKKLQTKKTGETMAKFDLEDLTGATGVCLFPKKYQSYGSSLGANKLVAVVGKVQKSDFGEQKFELIADEVYDLFEALNKWGKILVFNISDNLLKNDVQLKALSKILSEETGLCPVAFSVNVEGDARYLADTDYRVTITDSFIKAVTKIVGENCWRLDTGI